MGFFKIPISTKTLLLLPALLSSGFLIAHDHPPKEASGLPSSPRGSSLTIRIEKLKQANVVDFEKHLPPALGDVLRQVAKEKNIDIFGQLMFSRLEGLNALLTSSLDPQLSHFLLDLELENVIHEVGTTLEHFLGTYNLLKLWGNSHEIGAIGLFHAIYGTQFNPIQILNSQNPEHRELLSAQVGAPAEENIWLYGRMDVQRFLIDNQNATSDFLWHDYETQESRKLTKTQAAGLMETLVANAWDPCLKLHLEPKQCTALKAFQGFSRLLSEPAQHILIQSLLQ